MASFDLLSDAFFANPYPVLAAMQDEAPCWYDRRLEAHVVTRYRDVERILRDVDSFSSARAGQFGKGAPPSARDKFTTVLKHANRSLIFNDPPVHTRLRARLGQAFTPRTLSSVRRAGAEIVTDALVAMEGQSHPDLIRDFAEPVPTRLLAHVLGISTEDISRFKMWTDDIFNLVGAGLANEALVDAAYRSLQALNGYVLDLIRDRRAAPREDLLSALCSDAAHKVAPCTDEELAALYMVLFIAGHHSTTNQLGNALGAVLQGPGHFRDLIARQGADDRGINELFRYEGPFFNLIRRARVDTRIGNVNIRGGDFVFCMLNAANRDPRAFSEPHTIDPQRSRPSHLSFGTGIHSCIGATIARAIVKEAVNQFMHRFPTATVELTRVRWLSNISVRGMTTCPVALTGAAGRTRESHHTG